MARRSTLPDSLRSAETKLKRANLHKGIANREAVRFFNRHPGPTFRVKPEGDQEPSAAIGSINACRLVVETAPPELPASFAARFGDAIYNYRCVLDHIAWQLVLHGSSWPLPDKRAENSVQFPIYDASGDFTDKMASRLPGVHRDALDFIEARHKYVGGKATNNALLGLARLVNDDKHRQLHLFSSLFRTLQTNVRFERCEPLTWDNPPVRPALEKDAVVAHFSYLVTGRNFKVKMNLTPAVEIVDEHRRDFSEMLEGIRVEVTEILNAPEIHAAVS